jgi:hypothetical protein
MSSVLRLRGPGSTRWHNISIAQRTCDCAEFRQPSGHCSHLEALGIYPLRPFVAKTHPTFSQALSALVKSIRLRWAEDAVYWLFFLDTFKDAQHRYRTARRILIGSAEDGHSVAVMEKVVENFRAMSKPRAELARLVAEIVRICKVPNWWNPSTGGHDYVYNGMVGQRELAYLTSDRSQESMTRLIEQGIEEGRKTTALAGVMGLGEAKVGGTRQADIMLAFAKKYRHSAAERLVRVHLQAKSALANDNNFLCQAAWMMAGGVSPVAFVADEPREEEVTELLDRAKARWKAPRPIPGWCCDGIHSAGTDVRFTGMWQQMFAVCKAFEYYGRVHPEDRWMPEFQCYDGLMIEEQPDEC